MKIELSKNEYEYLMDNLLKDKELLRHRISLEDNNANIILSIENDIADAIRELACSEVALHFDENYEPTEEGRMIEHFIDKFYAD